MKTKFVCGYCQTEFFDYPSNRTKSVSGLLFCSKKCKGLYQTKKAIDNSPHKTESKCVDCGETKPIGEFYQDKKCVANGYVQYACKVCVKKERQKHYDENTDSINVRVRKYQKENPHRRKTQSGSNHAHQILNYAVKKGIVKKPKVCTECHQEKHLHAHHWKGYDNPLDVIWLCPSCHHAAHGRGPKARQLPSPL